MKFFCNGCGDVFEASVPCPDCGSTHCIEPVTKLTQEQREEVNRLFQDEGDTDEGRK
jgi:primosomal protein N'